jgi:O-antigen ligase
MSSSAIWQISFGIVIMCVMLAVALGARHTISIGALLILIPFQTIETRYGSSSVLITYALGAALLVSGGLKQRMLPWLSLIVLAYCLSLAFADRQLFMHNVLFMFQFFSCLVAFILAYNFALIATDERAVTNLLLVVNALVVVYCLLQLSAGPGQYFVPFGIDEFKFNLNRHPGDPRLVGAFDSPGSTAGYFALMTLVCFFEFMFSNGRRRILVCVLGGFNLFGLVATANRAGFLVLLAMAPLLLFTYRVELGAKKVVQYSVAGIAVLVMAATLAVTTTDFNIMFNRMETVIETEGGIPATRQEGWPVAVEKIKQRPWFGEGPYFWTAMDAKVTSQSPYEFEEDGGLVTAYDNYPHSLYLYLLRTVGIFGLLAVVGFFIRAWTILYGARRYETTGYRAAFIRLGLFLIPAFLISQITLEFHRPNTMDYAQFIFALMGLLVGTSDRSRWSKASSASPPARVSAPTIRSFGDKGAQPTTR